MEALLGLVILIFICVGVAKGFAAFIARPQRPASTGSVPASIDSAWEPPKAGPLPYSKRKYLFSAAERSFYEILKRLAPSDHTLFAKVRLADLVYVTKGTRSRQSHFNRIRGKHVDFLICNRDLAPVVAIELDDASHDEEDRQSRDEFVDQALLAAALPVVRVRAKRGYALDEVREMLLPYLLAQSPSAVAHPDATYMPPAGWRPAI